jgi:MFS transporter, DHA2 family, multidrug resistance protein
MRTVRTATTLANATGLSNFVRTMMGSVATAVTVWIWNNRGDHHHVVLTEHVRQSAGGWTRFQAQLDALGVGGVNAFQYVDRLITQQAATLGVNDVFFALGCLYFLLIPFVWLAKPPFVGGRGGAARRAADAPGDGDRLGSRRPCGRH